MRGAPSAQLYHPARPEGAVAAEHPMAEAESHALGQREARHVFCRDDEIPIDTNVSEREMKRVVLNRKNSLFVGNSLGGRTGRFWQA